METDQQGEQIMIYWYKSINEYALSLYAANVTLVQASEITANTFESRIYGCFGSANTVAGTADRLALPYFRQQLL
jgi:hypothetical protein